MWVEPWQWTVQRCSRDCSYVQFLLRSSHQQIMNYQMIMPQLYILVYNCCLEVKTLNINWIPMAQRCSYMCGTFEGSIWNIQTYKKSLFLQCFQWKQKSMNWDQRLPLFLFHCYLVDVSVPSRYLLPYL